MRQDLSKGYVREMMKLFQSGVLQKLEKFGLFLGMSYEGFEEDIKKLFMAILRRRHNGGIDVGSKSTGGKRLLKKLKKF